MSTQINPETYGPYDTAAFRGAEMTFHRDGTVSIRMKTEDLRAMANSAAHGEYQFAKSFSDGRDPDMPAFNRACEKAWQAIFNAANDASAI